MGDTSIFRRRPTALGEWGRLPTQQEVQERLDKLADRIESNREKVRDEFASEFALTAAVYGGVLVDLETARELYALVASHDGPWHEAWGEGLKAALRYATYSERTTGIDEGVRSARQQSAKSWIRDHRNIWVQLDGQGVFPWAIGDL